MNNKIINFHDVNDQKWFEETIIYLDKKYRIIGANELHDYFYNNNYFDNSCLLTIDDGEKSFYNTIYPILVKHNLPAILFVSPKIIMNNENFWFQEIREFDKKELNNIISDYFHQDLSAYTNFSILKNSRIDDIWKIIENYKSKFNIKNVKSYNMNKDELLKVYNDGLVEIGAHTQDHPILSNESDDRSNREISQSIKELNKILNTEIRNFAFPNGVPKIDFGPRELEFLKEDGIELAFTTQPRNFNKNTNPLTIPRFGLSYGNVNFIKMKLALGKHWNSYRNFKKNSEFKLRKKMSNLYK